MTRVLGQGPIIVNNDVIIVFYSINPVTCFNLHSITLPVPYFSAPLFIPLFEVFIFVISDILYFFGARFYKLENNLEVFEAGKCCVIFARIQSEEYLKGKFVIRGKGESVNYSSNILTWFSNSSLEIKSYLNTTPKQINQHFQSEFS